MKFNEETLRLYAQPLEGTEGKCLYAINEISAAFKRLGYSSESDEILPIEADTYAYATTLKKDLSEEEVQLMIQGSYANNTCVESKSAVDVIVIRRDQYDFSFGKDADSNVDYSQMKLDGKRYKDEIEKALRTQFSSAVEHKNKSIRIEKDADHEQINVVPGFMLRYVEGSDSNNFKDYVEGFTIQTDEGKIINSFPKQDIINESKKDASTNGRYKDMARIIKTMRYIMLDEGYKSAKKVTSYGLESLLWNLPDRIFTEFSTYKYVLGEILDFLAKNKNALPKYKEVNDAKTLCPTDVEVEYYSKFIDDLREFYEYDI